MLLLITTVRIHPLLDTNLAIEYHKHHPQSKILSIQVHPEEHEEDKKGFSFPNISTECIIAGIEVATLAGAQIIYLSVRTTSAKDIILLRECCSKVSQQGRLIITSEHNDPSRLRDFGDIYTISSKPISIVSSFYLHRTTVFKIFLRIQNCSLHHHYEVRYSL